jgi:hypothetical protein
MKIKELKTAQEITLLARYRDDSEDPLMQCDYGQFIEWLTKVLPANKETMVALAAVDEATGDPLGYMVLMLVIAPPVYNYGTVLRLSAAAPDVTKQLATAGREWAAQRDVHRVAVSTYDERAKNLYSRLYGLKTAGWQLHGEF